MTTQLFLDDAYLSTAQATVTAVTEDRGLILDQTVFYATSGGQPGDSGQLERPDGSMIRVDNTVFQDGKTNLVHLPADGIVLPAVGDTLVMHVDWQRRYNLMRMHTACHLLSVVCPYPISGAAVGETESRVDFDMSEAADKEQVSTDLMKLVQANHPIHTQWITEEELDANPDLVKSKNVKPPRGLGNIRLVCIGSNAAIDSQPCGGTHVSETQEVGDIHIGKIEKKGRENRRMRIRFGAFPVN